MRLENGPTETPECWSLKFQTETIFAENVAIFADNFPDLLTSWIFRVNCRQIWLLYSFLWSSVPWFLQDCLRLSLDLRLPFRLET